MKPGAITVPVRMLVSDDGLPVFAEIASRVAELLGSSHAVPVVAVPGTHATYHEHTQELAEAIRPFLRQLQVRGSA